MSLAMIFFSFVVLNFKIKKNDSKYHAVFILKTSQTCVVIRWLFSVMGMMPC